MKTGNKQHAILLSVVAIGALAFLVVQLKGIAAKNSVPPAGVPAPVAGASKGPANDSPDLPRTLFSDPFSHPALPKAAAEQQSQPSATQPKPTTTAEKLEPLPGRIEVTPLKPEVVPVDTRRSEQAPRQVGPVVCLQAVISSPTPVAFLSIDGKDPQKVTPGQTVLSNLSIISIMEGGIEVRLTNGIRKLKVGETIQL